MLTTGSTRELRERRARLVPHMRRLTSLANDSGHEWNAENESEWQRVNADYDALTRQIDSNERTQRAEADQRSPYGHPLVGRDDFDGRTMDGFGQVGEGRGRDMDLALAGWVRNATGHQVSPDEADACARYGVALNSGTFNVALRRTPTPVQGSTWFRHEKRAMSATTGSEGGSTVPSGMVASLETALAYYGPMLQVADVLVTDQGNEISWPTANDTENEGELLGENRAAAETDVVFGATMFRAYKGSSKLLRVSSELLQDSAIALADSLGQMLGERIGRLMNRLLTVGTGASQPMGIVTASTLGVTAAGAAAITMDEVLALIHSVDPAYREVTTGAGFMCHDNVMLALRLLKDDQGRFLWESSTKVGQPDRLFGFPVFPNNSMASTVATGNKTLLFGALRKYKVRLVRVMRLRRLVERFAEYDQDGFLALMRFDGNLLDAGTHPVKYLQQA